MLMASLIRAPRIAPPRRSAGRSRLAAATAATASGGRRPGRCPGRRPGHPSQVASRVHCLGLRGRPRLVWIRAAAAAAATVVSSAGRHGHTIPGGWLRRLRLASAGSHRRGQAGDWAAAAALLKISVRAA